VKIMNNTSGAFSSKFQKVLFKISDAFSRSLFVGVISSAFAMVLPFILIGSLFTLLQGMPINAWQTFLTSSGLGVYIGLPVKLTLNLLALYIVVCVGYQFAMKYKMKKQSINIALTSLLAFLVITPLNEDDSIPATWMGSGGMFMGILMAFLVGLIFLLSIKHNWIIKLPKQVPEMVSRQFSALIPAVLSIVVVLAIKWLFTLTGWGDPQTALYEILAYPLRMITANIWGFYLFDLSLFVFWFFGINGSLVMQPFIVLCLVPLMMENQAAYAAGTAIPNIVAGDMLFIGNGSLPFIIAMLIFSKSKANRAISKVSIVPSFFGVDEPAYFGYPMILNPLMVIPWVIVIPTIQVFGTYLLKLIGVLPYASCTGTLMAFVPFFIRNFFDYGWAGSVISVLLLALAVVIYIPFVKMFDKQCLAKEAAMEADEGTAPAEREE
jgi:PTS system cellobiose-specific IIC component